MAKLSKKALKEFDAAIDQLGGGAAPVPPPPKQRRAAASHKVAKPKPKARVKKR